MQKKAIKVRVVDNRPVVLIRVETYLLSNKRTRVVGQSKSAKEAVQRRKLLRPHVILLDIELPDLSATETIDMMRAALPSARILSHTMHRDRESIREFIRLGVREYVLKGGSPTYISRAVKAILGNTANSSPKVSKVLNRAIGQETAVSKDPYTLRAVTQSDYDLTQKEKEILGYVAQGLRMQEIAHIVSIRYSTLTTHFKHIYSKLGVHTRGAVVAKTLKENIL